MPYGSIGGRDRTCFLALAPQYTTTSELLSAAARRRGMTVETLPSAVVVDVGLLTAPDHSTTEWAVVQANMAWFSNAYAAESDQAIDVVLRAAGPKDRVAGRDRRFHRNRESKT
ncbi:MAG TPA: hypothetical protein VGP70_22000 [Actinomadura sp.]|nr:hypothetical protein [Actinomadura sp.]